MNVEIFGNSPEEIKSLYIPKVDRYWYSDDSIMALICIEGTADIELENGDTFPFEKRKYALIFRRKFIFVNKSSNFKVRILKVNNAFLTGLISFDMRMALNKLFCIPRVLKLSSSELKIFQVISRDLSALLRNTKIEYANEIVAGYLQVFTYSSLLKMDRSEELYENADLKREYEIADKFISLVKEDYMKSRKVGYYADKLNISAKYLSVLVKKATDRQPTEWIDDYTINEIKTRLMTTDQPIQRISEELGFSSASHMTKFFHDKTGSTPKEYRRSNNA